MYIYIGERRQPRCTVNCFHNVMLPHAVASNIEAVQPFQKVDYKMANYYNWSCHNLFATFAREGIKSISKGCIKGIGAVLANEINQAAY